MLQELHINAYGHQNTWLYVQTRNKRNTNFIFPTTQIVTPLPSPLLENMNECSIPSAAIAFICHVGARKFARFPFLFSRQLLTNKKFSTFFKKSVQRYISSKSTSWVKMRNWIQYLSAICLEFITALKNSYRIRIKVRWCRDSILWKKFWKFIPHTCAHLPTPAHTHPPTPALRKSAD